MWLIKSITVSCPDTVPVRHTASDREHPVSFESDGNELRIFLGDECLAIYAEGKWSRVFVLETFPEDSPEALNT